MNSKKISQNPDNIAVETKYYSPPWDPYRAMGYSFFISWAIAGIILGFNWRRLGKPNWFIPTVLVSIIIQGVAFSIMILWIINFRTIPSIPTIYVLFVPSFMAGILFAVPITLAKMQNGAYKRYKVEGRKALSDYKYNISDEITFGVLLSLIIGIIFLVGFELLSLQK
jgi:hypothetical protein